MTTINLLTQTDRKRTPYLNSEITHDFVQSIHFNKSAFHTLLFGILMTNSSDPACPVSLRATMPEPPDSAWYKNSYHHIYCN